MQYLRDTASQRAQAPVQRHRLSRHQGHQASPRCAPAGGSGRYIVARRARKAFSGLFLHARGAPRGCHRRHQTSAAPNVTIAADIRMSPGPPPSLPPAAACGLFVKRPWKKISTSRPFDSTAGISAIFVRGEPASTLKSLIYGEVCGGPTRAINEFVVDRLACDPHLDAKSQASCLSVRQPVAVMA